MNTSNPKLPSIRRWAFGLIGLLLICSLIFAFPSGIALAESNNPTLTPDPFLNWLNNGNLTITYHFEQKLLAGLQDNLNKTSDLVTKIQGLITRGQSNNLDTSALSAALTAFQTQEATAQSSLTTASNLLLTHAGFDNSGNVTDPTAAAQTVKDIGQALQDTHNALFQAIQNLHTAVRNWLEDNKGAGTEANLPEEYQNEQKWLTSQQDDLSKANDLVTKIQTLISNSNGLDTSALSSALTTYQTQLSTAQSSLSTAANLLSTHAGFDSSGNVTDPTAATQTIKDVIQALKTASDTLRQAIQNLHQAVRGWEAANKGNVQNQGSQMDYQFEQKWLTIQTENSSRANDFIAKVQDLITQAQSKHEDTSALESALTTFQSQLATVETDDNNVSTILTTHAGFDASGNLTDPTAAAQTVKDARQALSNASSTLFQAISDLQKALQTWKATNP
ncbi:MAG TPA: hypothetical protein VMT91_00695 [Anaerolineales bacterium]|nr:hypothetical protein [Anaerolineales bacterium]